MSQPRNPQSPDWRWDRDSRQWYFYDERTDELVFETGSRARRPDTIPRTAFTRAVTDSSHHSQTPSAQGNYYGWQTTSSSQQQQQQQQQAWPAGPTPTQGRSSGQTPYASTATRGVNLFSRVTADMASLNIHATRRVPASTAGPSSSQAATTGTPDLIDFCDPQTQVRNLIQTAPLDQITDPRLVSAGVFAKGRLLGTEGEAEPLYSNYRKRSSPQKYFVPGRVFFTLWAEPAGTSNSQATGQETGFRPGRYGQRVFSKIRRFVVVLEGDNFCTCLPITTYSHQGVSKSGVTKSHYSIIHTSRSAPPALAEERNLRRGEEPMQPEAIRVDADDPSDKLEPLSRLDYGKFYTIHHNLKVRNLGTVNPGSMSAFVEQWRRVTQLRTATSSTIRGPQADSLRMNPTSLPAIAESSASLQRRQSDARPGLTQVGHPALAPNTRGGFPASLGSAPGLRQQIQPGVRRRRDSGSESSAGDTSDDETVNEPTESRRAQSSGSDPSHRSTAQSGVANRVANRGFSAEASRLAVARQTSMRQDERQRDRETDSDSDVSSHGRASTRRSWRSRGSAANTTRAQRADNSRSGLSRSSATASQSQSRAATEQQRRPRQPTVAANYSSHQRTASSVTQTGAPLTASSGTASRGSFSQTNPRPAIQQHSQTVASSSSTSPRPASAVPATTAAVGQMTQQRWDAAIRVLVDQGFTRSQAIANLRQRYR